MTRINHRRILRHIIRNHRPFVEPPSAELEQDALNKFGDPDIPAVKAIFQARRNESWLTFSVEPVIAATHGLSQQAMTRAMDRLEGRLIETVFKERGKPREIRLLPDWENPEALAGDPNTYLRALVKRAYANHDVKLGGETEPSLHSYFSLPPEIIAKLRRSVDPPSDM